MSAALLTNRLSVGPLAPGAQVVLPHGIRYGDLPRKPNIIMPDRNTYVAVATFDELTITFHNLGILPESAEFFVELEHTIQRDKASDAEQIWKIDQAQ